MRISPRDLLRPGALVAAAGVLLAPGLSLGPSLDAAVFALVGVRIRDGSMPYRDMWDHKPPGVYLIEALGQAILPWLDPWLVGWFLTFVFTSIAILLIDRLLLRRLAPFSAFCWSLICLLGVALYPVALGGGLTESFALLPLLSALWLVAVRSRSLRAAAEIGCVLSVACLISLQSLPAAAVLAVAAVAGEGGLGAFARRGAAAVVGGLVLPALVLLWLVVGGVAGDAFDQIVTYNAAYRNSSTGLAAILPVALLLVACLIVPGCVTVAQMVRAPRSFGRVEWLCLAWTVANTTYVVFQDRIYLHYLVLAVPPLVLLAGPGMKWMWARLWSRGSSGRGLGFALTAVGVCAFLFSATVGVELTAMTLQVAGDDRSERADTAAWIRLNTAASARLFVWGDDVGLYLAADRVPYDRYIYQFPLVTAGYWSQARTVDLVEAWNASPPEVVVEVASNVPLFRPKSDMVDGRQYDTLAPLRALIRADYRLAASYGGDDIWVRHSSGLMRAWTAAGRGVPPGG
jgi:hypothetical protein